MPDESSRQERGDGSSSSSIPSVQTSNGSQPQSSLASPNSTGSSSENSLTDNGLVCPDSPSLVFEQVHPGLASAPSSKRQSPTLSSSPPSDSILHSARPQIRPQTRRTRSRPLSYPWLPSPPGQPTYHTRSHNSIPTLTPPYSRCHSEYSSHMSHSYCLDSKYPFSMHTPNLGMIQFDALTDDDNELGSDPEDKGIRIGSLHISWRGVSNMLSLLGLIGAMLVLFVVYPIMLYYRYGHIDSAMAANIYINSTGQAQDNAATTSLTPRGQHSISFL